MNLPNKITLFRIFITPVYFLFFFSNAWFGAPALVSVLAPWFLWAVIEASDIVDGIIARRRNLVTDLGKVMDPFADVLSRVTYFLCFAYAGIMPVWMFAIILYRELGITFLRMVMLQKGTVVAASIWGKLKAVSYGLSGVVGLIVISTHRLPFLSSYATIAGTVGLVVFSVAVFSSVASFLTYLGPIIRSFRDEA
ncbi:MAG: CDP-diacylglycerol--glycerol-3-phosphate 3-phosphatidyltransferase [Spirochaetales bacterium]|nr:CDP-diacylglycerol--glycerol-3-phosphate 3-phosphatidyltransferase [Spirochaetales bacterium]